MSDETPRPRKHPLRYLNLAIGVVSFVIWLAVDISKHLTPIPIAIGAFVAFACVRICIVFELMASQIKRNRHRSR